MIRTATLIMTETLTVAVTVIMTVTVIAIVAVHKKYCNKQFYSLIRTVLYIYRKGSKIIGTYRTIRCMKHLHSNYECSTRIY